ncbi:hypothetical protein SAMN06272735_4773 [Streptomyces sp. TLI_55]|nr:hypothetical protein SAMN06272735_4773 [Streptomyces sp. TLI_55]
MTATDSYAPAIAHRPSWLIPAVSDPLRVSGTGRLMEDAARLRTVTTSTARSAVAPPTPNPAKGR